MPYDDLLGRFVTLPVRRLGPPGVFLAVDSTDPRPNAPVLLLPRSEVPEGTKEGDELHVFVYLDSDDRPIATLRTPKVTLDEVAFLQVTDVNRYGAFFDWGLVKELLVPYGEQTRDVRVGERHPIGLFLDDRGRLAGTMRVSELLRDQGEYDLDAWIDGEAWRNDPDIGLFVILERRVVGLVPAYEPHGLSRGEAARFRVANILPDGKLELSLRGHAHEEIENDAACVLAVLGRPGAPRVGDRSSPDQIRSLFQLSKKAFKRAVGHLLKERAVSIDAQGFLVPNRR
ncbi:CvfB family protein [Polyangium sorediatum]|uniref:S1-like domain-containing RNA-binding protein n=1 Tax=Polyangium sorediatum TaxID=889274 RepID=A0ABT6NTT9_9BACT|nr:S1-like domain-containing RNA-binding protein [Polyangium sorediatum]MDI1431736.1 S1-like domain-containing RNA-binding protein [Polyangium sorediatum]